LASSFLQAGRKHIMVPIPISVRIFFIVQVFFLRY
jgi:hypothetical protein